jgi:hypothetical protein
LKPGGTLFIRDYGRHDLAQLRIKKERLLDPAYPGLYIRGDGTRVYFFPKKELEDLVTAPPRGQEGAMFKIEDSGEDRRMVRHFIDPGGADMVVGEPEIEVENVPNLVTDEGYEAACESMSLGVEGVILRSSIHTFNALHIYSITKLGRDGRNGANLKRIDIGVGM